MVEIEDVRLPILPSRKISTISIPNCDGEKINSTKYYNNYSIEIDILIDCDSREEVLEKIKTLKDIFDVSKPKPFSINDDRFILAISNDAIEKEPIAWYSYRSTIKLFCEEPYFYSYDIDLIEDDENKTINIVNNGNRSTDKANIIVGFSQDTYFLQLEQENTGKKFLAGKYPKVELTSNKQNSSIVFDDPCKTLANWTNETSSIGSDRGASGTLAVSEDNGGIILGTIGSDSTAYKGASARQNLAESIDEFKLTVDMAFNSYGENGDPSNFDADKDTDSNTVVTGSKKTYYEVKCSSLNYRTGGSTKYRKLGSLKKGTKIYNGTLKNGWLKFTRDGKTCYCYAKYLTKRIDDNTKKVTSTTTTENVMIWNTSGKAGVGCKLHESANIDSKNVHTLYTGEIVRIISSKKYSHTKGKYTYSFYKLAKKHDNYSGYVNVDNVLFADNTTVTYDAIDGVQTADDKTGTLELRGYTINSEELFCLQLVDDNQWFEYTKPQATVCNKVVLKDTNKAPKPLTVAKTQEQDGKTQITISNVLSGQYGSWNDFKGTWTLSRKKVGGVYEWNVTIQKVSSGKVIRTQKSVNLKDKSFSTESLAYIKLYLGTTGTYEKSCAMAISNITIEKLNNTDETIENVIYFKCGDILEIDCENHRCFLNEQPCDNIIDIGSRYFEVPTGESVIKVFSDDELTQAGIVFRKKYMGDN